VDESRCYRQSLISNKRSCAVQWLQRLPKMKGGGGRGIGGSDVHFSARDDADDLEKKVETALEVCLFQESTWERQPGPGRE